MSKGFETRFTHAMLMAILVVLTLNSTTTSVLGEIGRLLHAPLLISACVFWAWLGGRPPSPTQSSDRQG